MRITDIQVYQLKGRAWPRRPWVWVEVFTDEGISGIGESEPAEGVVEALNKLGHGILEEDPFSIEKIFARMHRAGGFLPAISGIEIALWDLVGKKLGTPIYNLIGGRCHQSLRVYLDGFFRGASYNPEEYAQKAREAVQRGFTALKADIDPAELPSAHRLSGELDANDMQLTVNVVKAVREAIGDRVDFAVDTHGSFNPPSIVRLARRLEPYDLMWIEDPVPRFGSNLRTLAKLARQIKTPICVGETLMRTEFREVFEIGATDLIMPDICYAGGILEMKKIAAMADTYHIPFCPHNYLGPVSTMANIQLCASVPNFVILEFQDGDVPWRDQVFNDPVPLKNGYLEIPTRPGLGVELNRQELTKHLVK